MSTRVHKGQSTFSGLSSTTAATINTTPDVLVNGCFNSFNTIACARSAILTFLAVLTTVLCVLKVIRLHHAHHQNWHQYFIFYCASLECTIAAVHWILSTYVQIDFVLQWLKLFQFLVMCHFYWTLATRALRREIWTKKFLVPFLAVALAYFTIIPILGIVYLKDSTLECTEPYWLLMSSAEFIIVQLFCVAGFYITRRLNEISTLDSVRRSQKRDLWCIVIVFEISALIGVVYDLTLRIVGDNNEGCSAIFNHAQELFSAIYLAFMIIKLLLPIWVMLIVFQPTQQVTTDEDLVPALSDDGNSAFSTNTDDLFRQLYQSGEDYRTLNYDTPVSNSPASLNAQASPNGFGPVVGVNTGGSMQQTAYKESKKSQKNLGTIEEENASRQRTPTATSPQPPGAQPRQEPGPTSDAGSRSRSSSAGNQQSGTERSGRDTANKPKFSIQGYDGESPPPSPKGKGKFFI